jgi:hypothetical protein
VTGYAIPDFDFEQYRRFSMERLQERLAESSAIGIHRDVRIGPARCLGGSSGFRLILQNVDVKTGGLDHFRM